MISPQTLSGAVNQGGRFASGVIRKQVLEENQPDPSQPSDPYPDFIPSLGDFNPNIGGGRRGWPGTGIPPGRFPGSGPGGTPILIGRVSNKPRNFNQDLWLLALLGLALEPEAVAPAAMVGELEGVMAAEGIAGADSAANAVNGVRLAQQLSAQSMFDEAGGLSADAIAGSRQILGADELVNPAIPDGFAKYSTQLFDTPAGPGQVHFYMNPGTGEAYYGLDYRFLFQSSIGK